MACPLHCPAVPPRRRSPAASRLRPLPPDSARRSYSPTFCKAEACTIRPMWVPRQLTCPRLQAARRCWAHCVSTLWPLPSSPPLTAVAPAPGAPFLPPQHRLHHTRAVARVCQRRLAAVLRGGGGGERPGVGRQRRCRWGACRRRGGGGVERGAAGGEGERGGRAPGAGAGAHAAARRRAQRAAKVRVAQLQGARCGVGACAAEQALLRLGCKGAFRTTAASPLPPLFLASPCCPLLTAPCLPVFYQKKLVSQTRGSGTMSGRSTARARTPSPATAPPSSTPPCACTSSSTWM